MSEHGWYALVAHQETFDTVEQAAEAAVLRAEELGNGIRIHIVRHVGTIGMPGPGQAPPPHADVMTEPKAVAA